jgi:hypothetical protein
MLFLQKINFTMFSAIKVFSLFYFAYLRDEGMLSSGGKSLYNFKISLARNAFAGLSGVERGEKRIVNQFVAGSERLERRVSLIEHKFIHRQRVSVT